MDGSERPAESDRETVASWLGFWAQFVVLGLLAILGAFWASDGEPGDYSCGLWLSLAAIALAFLRLRHRLDNGPGGWGSFLFVDDMGNLLAAIVVLTILGLIGLVVGAGTDSASLEAGGVALFLVCALAILLNVKRVFDNRDAGH